jgi:hypothetical protein
MTGAAAETRQHFHDSASAARKDNFIYNSNRSLNAAEICAPVNG